jgi:flagellar basal body-associated protein FliL
MYPMMNMMFSNEGAIIIILTVAMRLLIAAAAIKYLFFSKK